MRKILLIITLLFSINSFADDLRTDIPAYTGEWGLTAIKFYNDEILKHRIYATRYLSKKDYNIVTNCLLLSIKEGFPVPTDAVSFISL